MIIKLPIPLTYIRHKEARATSPLTFNERVKTDRLVMILLLALTVIGAAYWA